MFNPIILGLRKEIIVLEDLSPMISFLFFLSSLWGGFLSFFFRPKLGALGIFFYFRGEFPRGLLPRILAYFTHLRFQCLFPFILACLTSKRVDKRAVCFISSSEPLSFCYILGEYRIYPKPPKPHLKTCIVSKSSAVCALYELGVRLLLISFLHGVEGDTPICLFSSAPRSKNKQDWKALL